MFGFKLILLLFVAFSVCKSPDDSGVGYWSCAEAMKLYFVSNILNDNNSIVCKVQWDGAVLSCKMM